MKTISEYDSLGELFRQRLEGHQTPVTNSDWSDIERRLPPPRHKVLIRTQTLVWWLGGAAAAAVVLFLLLPVTVDETPTMAVIVPQEDTIIIEDSPVSIAQIVLARETAPVTQTTMEQKEDEDITTTQPDKVLTDVTDPSPAVEKAKETPAVNLWLDEALTRETYRTKRANKWILAAVVGAGGGRTEGSGHGQANYSRPSAFMRTRSSGNEYAARLSSSIQPFEKMTKDDYSSIRHLPPLSLGILARTPVGEANVEFGVVYTYLASRFTWDESGRSYHVRQSLHYIGVPVNLVGYLWKSQPNWKIYFSVGGMVEKGLRGIYRQDMFSTNRTTFTTVKSSIDGVQWSVNGALGVDYRLSKKLSLYVEPRTGYHFDCSQPLSMRTEWPFYIGFGMGVHYDINKK